VATRIDTYVKHLLAQNAQGMVMRTGQLIQLRYADGPPKPTKKNGTDEEIKALTSEIMDDAAATSLARNGRASFLHVAEGGVKVRVTVERSPAGGGMKCEVALEREAPLDEDVPPPEMAPRAAPQPAARPAPARPLAASSVPPGASARVAAPPPAAEPAEDYGDDSMDEPPPEPAPPAPQVRVTGGGKEPGINKWLRMVVERKASDLHLRSDVPPHTRVSGGMVMLDPKPLSPEAVEALLFEVLSEEQAKLYRERHDYDFAHAIPGAGRFRMNYFVDRRGYGMVARLIPEKILSLEELGCPASFKTLCELNRGLVLVTGPTGSGKSTTLAAMIDYINANNDEHILTLEDPIEFVHPQKKCVMTQREIHTHTHSFGNALRAALREDPDTILVGEMRDLETIAMAIETAETGHLVFGTLHTNTAPSTVDRIIDVFPADRQEQIRAMLASSLKGVIAQTLLRRVGGGRIAAWEVMLGTFSVANLIREGKTFQLDSIIQTGKSVGMMTQTESIFNLVQKKLVAPEEAYSVALNKVEMKKLLSNVGWAPKEGD